MKKLLSLLFFIAVLVLCLPQFALAEETKTNANDTCLTCHNSTTLKVNRSGQDINLFVDKAVLGGSVHNGLDCTSCHDVVVPHKNPVYGQELLNEINSKCLACHYEINKTYQPSVHRQNIMKGSQGAACTDCHGTHDVKKSADPNSKTYRLNISQTCTNCHKGDILESYNYSFHGSAVKLGYEKSATCVDCHNAHDILSPQDPLSTVNEVNQPKTCAKCHLTPQTNFAKGSEHVVPQDKDRAFPLWIIWKIFIVIILIDVLKDGSIAIFELFRRIRNNSNKSFKLFGRMRNNSDKSKIDKGV